MDNPTEFPRDAMAAERDHAPSTGLYERDFHAWALDRARALRARHDDQLDWSNIAEEIEDLGRNSAREALSRTACIIQHLLKWEYQPERRTRSWRVTINTQRDDLNDLFEQSPSLLRKAELGMAKAWERGARRALDETGLDPAVFPNTPTYTLEQIRDTDFLPGTDTDGVTDEPVPAPRDED